MEPHVGEDHVRIFDTTLRDGEQSPGCTMTLEEKLEVARQLARLRVDIIESGFPAASPGDWAAVHEIARDHQVPGAAVGTVRVVVLEKVAQCGVHLHALVPPGVGPGARVGYQACAEMYVGQQQVAVVGLRTTTGVGEHSHRGPPGPARAAESARPPARGTRSLGILPCLCFSFEALG